LRRLRLRHKAPPASTPRYQHVRTFLIVVPRPVPKTLPAATGEEHSADERNNTAAPLLCFAFSFEEGEELTQQGRRRGKICGPLALCFINTPFF
jgi:hypothetical protein